VATSVSRRRCIAFAVAAASIVPLLAGAQFPARRATAPGWENPGYAGRFVFTRIRYGSGGRGFGWGGSTWSHDFPQADLHLPRILEHLTTVHVQLDASNVLTFDEAELFKHPVAYLSEPGFWALTDSEARRMREYVLKGGFLIFDDFEAEQWHNFEAQVRRALPEFRLIEIDFTHPIFHSFFEIDTLDLPHPLVGGITPRYYGMFEGNDPTRRMLAIVNYNNDVAEYWEWSDTGWLPIDLTNDAYKLGVNYIVYALTH